MQYYRFAKGTIKAKLRQKQQSQQAQKRYENRLTRIEQEKINKKARRKARAEAAVQAQQQSANKTDNNAALIQAALARVQSKKAAQDKILAKPAGDNNKTNCTNSTRN